MRAAQLGRVRDQSEFEDVWGTKRPALVAVRRRSWEHFVMLLRFPPELRKIVCTTKMIESPTPASAGPPAGYCGDGVTDHQEQ
ncbi:transposase [Streptomyces sp. RKAG337]|nr:transposase [Streptomyces sp. RKAG337]MCM2424936.1 transposase [Streptomyces sp. RKAG337]